MGPPCGGLLVVSRILEESGGICRKEGERRCQVLVGGTIPGEVGEMPSRYQGIDNLLTYTLDALSLRQRVTANNIANVNTPGFKRGTVPFEAELRRAIDMSRSTLLPSRTHPRHLLPKSYTPQAPSVVVDRSTTIRNDGNNVDIEREVAQQAKDALLYQAVISQVNRRFGALRSVIHDGRR